MFKQKKLIVSHAPFWHNGSSIFERNYNIIIAALPAALAGISLYGIPALAVLSLSISSAILWELIFNRMTGQEITIGDGNAALIGLLFGMLIPGTSPWWFVITGTLVAIIMGKQIFGGIGSNPVNPALLAVAILMVSWKNLFDFNAVYLNYDFGFAAAYPLATLKHFGAPAVSSFSTWDLLIGNQVGGIGATCGLALTAGGIYLILRGFIRWEISISFLIGIYATAMIFNMADPIKFAAPTFHILTGYTLIGAFFLATEDSSSPVNIIPMFIYGAGAGLLTVLIRNIGVYIDGVVFAILIMNLINPLLDNIRPKAMGKVS